MAEQIHLFRFGFESPAEERSNREQGTDFESSAAVWIRGDDANAALRWGREVAEQFVSWLFEANGTNGYSWERAGFAHWIETDPGELERTEAFPGIPTVSVGQAPDFRALLG